MAAVLPVERTELSRRIGSGDTAAFAGLMRRHNRMLFRTARAILRDDAEAEDALQEAYLRAYRSIGHFRGEARLSTWLVRIVANEALARLRKSARRAEIVPISNDIETDIPSNDGPELGTQRSEIRRLLEEKIDALPEAYRSVFALRALEEFSVEETAAALDIPEATVRTRFFRARSQLREALSQEIDLAFDDAFAFAGERCDRIVAAVLARLAADGEGLH
jgi:RNA polymerase sigma-70 factor (ECF subfamily)